MAKIEMSYSDSGKLLLSKGGGDDHKGQDIYEPEGFKEAACFAQSA